MIRTAISLGELPKNFSDILNRVIMPEESVLPVETKEISIIPPEHEQIIKEIAMEPINKEAEFSLSCMMAQAVTTKILPPYFFRQNYMILKKEKA